MAETVGQAFDRIEARIRRESEIHCPACDAVYDDWEDAVRRYTMHGSSDNGEFEVECPACEQVFFVREDVSRTYESRIPADGETCDR